MSTEFGFVITAQFRSRIVWILRKKWYCESSTNMTRLFHNTAFVTWRWKLADVSVTATGFACNAKFRPCALHKCRRSCRMVTATTNTVKICFVRMAQNTLCCSELSFDTWDCNRSTVSTLSLHIHKEWHLNTFADSYLNTQGLNNSCLKSPASTLVDLTF